MEGIEKVQFVFQIGSMVLKTAESIIADKNLLKGEGVIEVEDRKFKVTVEEVDDDTEI
ncbi:MULTISPECIES: hypothetical protein [unclassified Streptococcus]|uniref:hypothetical protein n=1 Tax=unclassified Streptococcus TaxID=2608887 RepID=UPI00211B1D7E|nr:MULTISPECIES: hypothetical protein [unclassified Streptococcus]MCQ9211639.1 hypothetical protein [Streptococcus sp. B01]MCQ9213156.1 hypothetical protein [Streptococcus sp. O1]MCQ9214944.1 hypothetical protein [Streptococcus sp. O1]MCQ9215078.1 hypothetical protein [Streptococcus sp. O1]